MSRQKVEQAVSLAAGGSLKDALRLLGRLEVDFVRKRLMHHLNSVERDRQGALLLWRNRFPGEAPPPEMNRTKSSVRSARRSQEAPAGPVVALPARLLLENPGPTLAAVDRASSFVIDLDHVLAHVLRAG